jgi:rare lipoprotein A (peptidoglycan hydrolase)
MPRSTLRCALGAGALCLTAATTVAVTPAAADAAPVSIAAKRMNIHTGNRVAVKGRAAVPGTVKLQIRRHDRWVTLDRSRTRGDGRFVLRKRVHRALSARARVRSMGGARWRIGRLNVYRRAHASWYGPGLYGNQLGCGGRLRVGSVGVANKTLPCGTKVTLRHHGRVLRVRVIDRGPYVGGREYDLTAATARKLRFRGHGPIQVTR